MSTRTSPWPAGTPCWLDLATTDVPGAIDFYGDLFGWTFEDTGEQFGHYRMASVGGAYAAGVAMAMTGAPTAWMLYLASDDVDATAAAITANGGTVVFEPMDIPGSGRMCIAADPGGATFGVWQHGGHIGSGIVNQAGGLSWEDNWTAEPSAVQPFYREVFGWEYDRVPGDEMEYYTVRPAGGQEPIAGAGKLFDDGPARWAVYLGVDSADRAVEVTLKHGGTVLRPAEDTPFGRMTVLADPAGAAFTAIEPGPQSPDRSG